MLQDLTQIARHGILNYRVLRRRRRHGRQRLTGEPVQVLKTLQERLWNGRFIPGSTGHFEQLWPRDLAFFTEAYVQTGQRDRLMASWRWALEKFEAQDRLTTTIWPDGCCYDLYTRPADTLPLMLWSLLKLEAQPLILKHQKFLRTQAEKYFEYFLEPDGRVRRRHEGTGMKDCVYRQGCSYTYFMAWSLHRSCKALGWNFTRPEAWRDRAIREYWSSDGYFFEDRRRRSILSADVNIIPLWLELLPLEDYWELIKNAFDRAGMLDPFPIRMTDERSWRNEKLIPLIFAPNYQGTTYWANVGLMFLELARRAKDPSTLNWMNAWTDIVRRYGNLPELFTSSGDVYSTWMYDADEGMNWSVQLLALLQIEFQKKSESAA